MKTAYGVTIVRVSDKKGITVGNSHENQEEQIELAIKRKEQQENIKIKIVDTIPYVGSGQVDQEYQPLLLALQEIKKMKPKPQYAFVKSVDRGQRHSGEMMLFLYDMYNNEGIKLVDVYGVLQDYSYNMLEHTGFEFKWSKKNPARKMIYLEGERAHEEVQDILSRMISAEIKYVREGYAVGEPPMGIKTIKVQTTQGLRSVWAENEEESGWIKKFFELLDQGHNDNYVMEKVNQMGYKSRLQNVFDKNDKKRLNPIGHTGGKPLEKKEFDRIRRNPAYAGIMKHEWLKHNKDDIDRYVKAKHFDGLITPELWNRVNKGKFMIVKTLDGGVTVVDLKKKDTARQKKDKHNPDFPFKNVILCPTGDGKTLNGSSPKNGSGGYTRTYHHGWNHKYYGINAEKLEEQVYKFLNGIEFKEEEAMRLRKKMLGLWEMKRGRLIDEGVSIADRIKANAIKQQQLSETINLLRSPKVIAMKEEELNGLLVEEEDLKQLLTTKQEEKIDVQMVINEVTYYLEHIGEIIKTERDTRVKEALFALVVEELPTVSDLYFGTAKLACVFKLKDDYNATPQHEIPSGEPDGIRTCDQELKRLLLYR